MAHPLLLKIDDDGKHSNNKGAFSKNRNFPPKAKEISISILAVTLPFLYVFLLHVHPSNLFGDTTFWFLFSNTIILVIAVDSGMFSSSSSDAADDIYEEYIRRSKAEQPPSPPQPVPQPQPPLPLPSAGGKQSSKTQRPRHYRSPSEGSLVVKKAPASRKPLRRSVTEKKSNQLVENNQYSKMPDDEKQKTNQLVENSEYSKMSDEELNRRVEDFIKRFKEVRRQELGR